MSVGRARFQRSTNYELVVSRCPDYLYVRKIKELGTSWGQGELGDPIEELQK